MPLSSPYHHPLRRGERFLLDRLVAHPQRSGQGFVLPLLAVQLSHQLLHQRRVFGLVSVMG
ncbi:MAG: hypothetical protein WBH09_10780 [Rugosibacter sp.]